MATQVITKSLSGQRIRDLVESTAFQTAIIVLVIINAIILGLETSASLMERYGAILKTIDGIIIKIFVVEISLRLYAYKWRFFTKAWSVFDLIIIGIALIPASETLAALRALRVLRVLRLISVVPAMRCVIEGLVNSIPGFTSVLMIIALFFYVFAVIGTHIFAEDFPQWFGTIGRTMYSLFQIMTLESWSMGIVRPIMVEYPWAWLYFVTYIILTAFIMLNFFIAVIINAMHQTADDEAEDSRKVLKQELIEEIKSAEERIIAQINSSKRV